MKNGKLVLPYYVNLTGRFAGKHLFRQDILVAFHSIDMLLEIVRHSGTGSLLEKSPAALRLRVEEAEGKWNQNRRIFA